MRTFYLETSIWGVLVPGQPAEMQRASLRLLKRLKPQQAFISTVVSDEIYEAKAHIRKHLASALNRFPPTVLEVSTECDELAQAYIDAGVVPAKKTEDAAHVAVATVYEIGVLLSWNYKHLANVRKTELFRAVNLLHGYTHSPEILTPFEVLHG